jgi:hypothetical protein
MFGCEALNLVTSCCITFASIWVCACQNWIVTLPVEAGLGAEDPAQPATARVNAAIPASAVRFIPASSSRQPLAAADDPLTASVIACTNPR